MIWFIIIPVIVFFLIPFFAGFTGNYDIMRLYGVTYTDCTEQETEPEEESEQSEDINKLERIQILDDTLVQYVQLLNSLATQLKNETNEKERSRLLAKQITTLEKYNKALEKREKLDS